MKLQKCSNNHYYDEDKYLTCPHCSDKNRVENNDTVGIDPEGVTFIKESPKAMGITQTLPISQPDVSIELPQRAPNHQNNQNYQNRPIQQVKPIAKSLDTAQTIAMDMLFDVPPVVGWLVCIEGEHFGEDFRLKAGINYIGRSNNMDISLSNDRTISREKHAVVVYEPKEGLFLVHQGDSKTLFYRNNKVVLQVERLEANDILEVGKTKLMFIPLCNDVFNWKTIKGKLDEK